MGLLMRVDTGAVVALASQVVVGRGPACAISSSDPRVSAQHASICWRGDRWTVRDLASRNGTLHNGAPLAAGVEATLAEGDVLEISPSDRWRVAHAGPPAARARNLRTGVLATGSAGVLCLPDDDQPVVSLYGGASGVWSCDRDDTSVAVADGERILVGTDAWLLHLPTTIDPTTTVQQALGLRLTVSRDEERVTAEVICGGRATLVGRRAHMYLLVVLGRARLAAGDRPPPDRGWLHREQLAAMLRCDPITVNVQMHRVRADLGRTGFELAPALLETRARTGQIRVATDDLEIVAED